MRKRKATATLANLQGLDALRLAKEPIPEPKAKRSARSPSRPRPKRPAPAAPSTAVDILEPEPEASERSVGRPRTGKRSNDDFHSVTVYIRRQTHADVDDLLRKRRRVGQIPPGKPQDVSELVEELLADWYREQS